MTEDLALLVLRVTAGAVIAAHGTMKLGWWGMGGSVRGVGAWFDSMGMRPGLFWAAVATGAEAGGGLLMVLGLGGPIGPALVFGDLVVVTLVAHWAQGFWVAGGKAGWEFPAPIAAGALAVALLGPGAWSLDGALGLAYPEWLTGAAVLAALAGAVLALAIKAVAGGAKEQA